MGAGESHPYHLYLPPLPSGPKNVSPIGERSIPFPLPSRFPCKEGLSGRWPLFQNQNKNNNTNSPITRAVREEGEEGGTKRRVGDRRSLKLMQNGTKEGSDHCHCPGLLVLVAL